VIDTIDSMVYTNYRPGSVHEGKAPHYSIQATQGPSTDNVEATEPCLMESLWVGTRGSACLLQHVWEVPALMVASWQAFPHRTLPSLM